MRTWLGPDASQENRSLVHTMQRDAFEVQLAAGDDAEFDHREVDPSAIDSPTLVVSGGLDLPHFRQVATELTDRIPNAEHVELEWARHLPSLERPGRVAELLLEHLAASA